MNKTIQNTSQISEVSKLVFRLLVRILVVVLCVITVYFSIYFLLNLSSKFLQILLFLNCLYYICPKTNLQVFNLKNTYL